jgi:uncharacterized membrane protein
MKVWLVYLWDKIRGSFWFAPATMSVAAVLLAAIVPQIDQIADVGESSRFGWLATTVSAARTTLSSLAAAMVTVVSVVFSITMVTLSLTMQQFGPRLLRRFMQNRVTQLSLGAFLATSLYSLLMLRWVDEATDSSFVPHLGVATAVLLAIISFAGLIWFIHDVSQSIQAQNVVTSVAEDLDAAITRLFPEELGATPEGTRCQADAARAPDDLGEAFRIVLARQEGYVEAVDNAGLLASAVEGDLVLELLARPGDFVVREQPLARAWSSDCSAPDSGAPRTLCEINSELAERLNAAFITGNRRTPRQDVECAVNELVEVAVRALSPGINDPFTAMTSIDRLGASLARLARRKIPSPCRYDGDGRLRVIAPVVSFPAVLAAAFNQIRQYGRPHPAVTIRLMESLVVIASSVIRDADRAAVRQHAEMIRRGAHEAFSEPSDCADLDRRYQRVVDALAGAAKDTIGAARGRSGPAAAPPRPARLTPDRESLAEDSATV